MPTSKKRKYQRKQAKQYRMVQFTSDIFDDVFEMPDQQHMNLGLVTKMNDGDLGALVDWLREAGVDPEALDAIMTLDQGEIQTFIKEWGNGSLINLGESEG